ncbi:hypothetical protein LTR78_002725 [Recurvomyces mirabilis]|uniref:C2H2-type domain-containing protein n=1 Tax=Recurvomyces mirabilis TaxID=574656 RepID=A0AAE0WSU2_9PEZI|nr:hypothetical protein LTR78_002725 [Recurvomyces mirabilis]KAK5159540.1 hypothetical protein LTS14_002682 [Recurvomyces mirabilis]
MANANADTPPALQPAYQLEDLFVDTEDVNRFGEFGFCTSPELSAVNLDASLEDVLLAQYARDFPPTLGMYTGRQGNGGLLALTTTTARRNDIQPTSMAWSDMTPNIANIIPLPTIGSGTSLRATSNVKTMLFQALSRQNSPLNGRTATPTRKNSEARLRLARTVALCMWAFKDKSLLAYGRIFSDPSTMDGWMSSGPRPQPSAAATTLALARPAPRANVASNLEYTRKCQRHPRIQGGYPCELCDGIFDTFADCNKHKRNVHASTRPHACSQCSKAFCTPKDLRRHAKKHARKTAVAKLRQNAVPAVQHIEASPSTDANEPKSGSSKDAKCHSCQSHLPQVKCTPEYVDIIQAENESLKHRCKDLESEVSALRALLLARAGSVG